MKLNTKALKAGLKTFGLALEKNAPTIMTGASVGLLVMAVGSAIKGTIDAENYLVSEQINALPDGELEEIFYDDFETRHISVKNRIKSTWKFYIPTAVFTLGSAGLAIASNWTNLRRNAALVSALAISGDKITKYKDKLEEILGEEKANEIDTSIAQDKVTQYAKVGKFDDIIDTGNGDILCMDAMTGQAFYSSPNAIDAAINEANNAMLNESYLMLNDYLDYLGLRETALGSTLVWRAEKGLLRITSASTLLPDKRPCLYIEPNIMPIPYNYY